MVVLPSEDALVVADPTTHLRLCAQVIDLQQYAVRWVEGDNPWSATQGETLVLDKQEPLPGVEPPRIRHRDIFLKMPETCMGLDGKLLRAAQWVLQFDGGASPKQK